MNALHLSAADRVRVMGVLNVTPDSFSDGGGFVSEPAIVARVEDMLGAGVDIIDVGGESSRPFSEPVAVEEELARVLPAIRLIRARSSLPVSIDTTKAEVARQALDLGADMINDISALRFDPEMVALAATTDVPVIIMHMQGTPRDMQLDPHYEDVVAEINAFFQERLDWAADRGVARQRFILDPGIGFGKTLDHNLTILKHLEQFQQLGLPLLVGHSRKAFIGTVLGIEDAADRDVATAAVSALCVAQGVAVLRVHDVGKTVQAVRMARAISMAQ
ncbi:MAG: dihydropteroate synthase [Desulfobacterales bacterium]|nr:dihydropteroate synthase [Desulfobacterales bacterium]